MWSGITNGHGYGLASIHSRNQSAHRLVYEALVGKIPAGKQLDHLCRNTMCVNPAHLEPVSQRENILRGVSPAAKRARWDKCPQGHDLTWCAWSGPKGRPRRICQTCKRETRRRYNMKKLESVA